MVGAAISKAAVAVAIAVAVANQQPSALSVNHALSFALKCRKQNRRQERLVCMAR